MQKRKNWLLVVLTVAVIVICMIFSACGGTNNPSDIGSNPGDITNNGGNPDDGAYYMVGYPLGSTKLELPNALTISGQSHIYKIRDSFAMYDDKIVSVVFSDYITEIGSFAFNSCTNLTTVTLGQRIKSIGTSAFNFCGKLIEIYNKSNLIINEKTGYTDPTYGNTHLGLYAENVYEHDGYSQITTAGEYMFFTLDSATNYLMSYFGDDTELELPELVLSGETEPTDYIIYENAFGNNEDITSVKMLGSVKRIDNKAFYNCVNLKSVELPESLKEIGEDAFRSCKSIESIAIPDSVSKIERYAFNGCAKLKELTLGNSLEDIGAYAFGVCPELESVVIPDRVSVIGANAFYNCIALKEVVIGSHAQSIGANAFSGGYSNKAIYYNGSESEWTQVECGENLMPETSVLYYYSETQPTAAGNYWHYVDNVPTAW